MMEYPDIVNFSRDELLDEFCKLFDRYQDLKESNEVDTQKIHELKRSLETATAAQSYLSQELEQYTNAEDKHDDDELLQKIGNELTDVKKRYSQLEHDFNSLLEESAKLRETLDAEVKRKECIPVAVETVTVTTEDDLQRIEMLENENMELLEKMQDFEEQTVNYTLTIAEFEKNIEILRDQINCLEENLQSKKEDLEEKLQILESTQEQLAEANAKIAMLSAAPENSGSKGNSLFAEVDDQRQVMKQLLTTQKKSYLHMKKIYNESEHEIRRLKRENIAMHHELEVCTSIFCKADKVYQDKLNERIGNLLRQNSDLESKLKWTQDQLKELASEKGVLWLDSMLSFCKKETDDLKNQLRSERIQKASLEEQLRNIQQDLARWRFESLKSRCFLLDREHLLTENNIEFKPVQAIEFKISEKEQNQARPRIINNRRSNTFDNIIRRSLTPLNSVKDENANDANNDFKKTEENTLEILSTTSTETGAKDNKQMNNLNMSKTKSVEVEKLGSERNEAPVSAEQQTNSDELEQENKLSDLSNFSMTSSNAAPNIQIAQKSEEKENCMTSSVRFSKLQAGRSSPMRPSQKPSQDEISGTPPARSILTKERDLFSKEPSKVVTFSSKEDLVHNLSSYTPSPTGNNSLSLLPNNDASSSTPTSANPRSKAVVKETHKKSNVVVRRVVIGSSKRD